MSFRPLHLGLLVASLAVCSAEQARAQQAAAPVLPRLPERHDTLTASINGSVIGRAITTWTRVGLEQLQVYRWEALGSGTPLTDSTFMDPSTLLPVRQVRVIADTIFTVHYGRDSLFISRQVAERSSTSHAPAPALELYSSSSISMLAASMPLRVGVSRSTLVFFAPPASTGSTWVVFVVDGRVVLNGRNAWRVLANTRAGSTTFWVDERTRSVVQMDVLEGESRVTFR